MIFFLNHGKRFYVPHYNNTNVKQHMCIYKSITGATVCQKNTDALLHFLILFPQKYFIFYFLFFYFKLIMTLNSLSHHMTSSHKRLSQICESCVRHNALEITLLTLLMNVVESKNQLKHRSISWTSL